MAAREFDDWLRISVAVRIQSFAIVLRPVDSRLCLDDLPECVLYRLFLAGHEKLEASPFCRLYDFRRGGNVRPLLLRDDSHSFVGCLVMRAEVVPNGEDCNLLWQHVRFDVSCARFPSRRF